MYNKFTQEFELKDKKLDENFKNNALGTVGLAILKMVEEGNIVKLAGILGTEAEIEDLIDVKVVDDLDNEKTVKEKGKKNVYRLTVDMVVVPKSSMKSKCCNNPFNAGAKEG